jgi:predicted O-methyltransferase YrrM
MNYDALLEKMDGSASGFNRHYGFLFGLVRGMRPRIVLELGCGLSTIVILEALSRYGGHLTTLDMRPIEETGNTREDIEKYKDQWNYIQGDSQKSLAALSTTGLDLVLHDGSHEWRTVMKDIWKVAPRIKKNGILLVHDTMHPNLGRGIRMAVRLGLLVTPHTKVTLPYGYGLTIVRIKKDSGNGVYKDAWEKKKSS